MTRISVLMVLGLLLGLTLAAAGVSQAVATQGKADEPAWALNATIIEACSCPMFCQCYFNTKPAAHSSHEGHGRMQHFCRFNLAYKVNRGYYGPVKLDGAKFWLAGDLGSDYSEGQTDWAVLTFDTSVTKAQRDGIAAIMGHVYPVKWKSFTTAEGTIDTWEYTKDAAHATLDGGKTAEVKLKRFPGMSDEPIVIKNLKYWAVPRHGGIVLMPNQVQAYRVSPKAFETRGTNGFMISLDMTSKDVM